MIQLELTPDEAERRQGILEDYLSELRVEVAHTDDRAYRQGLQAKEAFIKTLRRRLEESAKVIASVRAN